MFNVEFDTQHCCSVDGDKKFPFEKLENSPTFAFLCVCRYVSVIYEYLAYIMCEFYTVVVPHILQVLYTTLKYPQNKIQTDKKTNNVI
jgi:hypothetical protein